jgi:hypothetical protein
VLAAHVPDDDEFLGRAADDGVADPNLRFRIDDAVRVRGVRTTNVARLTNSAVETGTIVAAPATAQIASPTASPKNFSRI